MAETISKDMLKKMLKNMDMNGDGKVDKVPCRALARSLARHSLPELSTELTQAAWLHTCPPPPPPPPGAGERVAMRVLLNPPPCARAERVQRAIHEALPVHNREAV